MKYWPRKLLLHSVLFSSCSNRADSGPEFCCYLGSQFRAGDVKRFPEKMPGRSLRFHEKRKIITGRFLARGRGCCQVPESRDQKTLGDAQRSFKRIPEYQKSPNILRSFPGGVWGCSLKSQLPRGDAREVPKPLFPSFEVPTFKCLSSEKHLPDGMNTQHPRNVSVPFLKSHFCSNAAFCPFLEQAPPSAFHLEPSEASPLHNRDCSPCQALQGWH